MHQAEIHRGHGNGSAANARGMTVASDSRTDRPILALWSGLIVSLLLSLLALEARSEAVSLKSIDFGTTSGGSLRFEVTFDGPIAQPRMFQTDNPPRIAIDFPGVRNGLTQKNIPVKLRGAESIQVLEGGGRTRAVLNLAAMAPYTGTVQGNRFVLTVQTGTDVARQTAPVAPRPAHVEPARTMSSTTPSYVSPRSTGPRVDGIDFRRGESGEGRVIVALSDAQSVVDVRRQGQKIVVDLPRTSLAPQVARRYDVLDFGTPVKTIEALVEGGSTRLVITPASQQYDYSSYQTDRVLTVELRPLSRAEVEQARQDKALKYSGERLSLNFQDIPIRSVLQIIADFTNVNIVASDSVQGSVTLRLNEVPWDQALDVVMQLKGLAKRQDGNIIRVGPAEEIADFERKQLEAHREVEALEPLKTELIQINYAKAVDILQVLVGEFKARQRTAETRGNGGVGYGAGTESTVESQKSGDEAILTSRGSATIDPRSNILIVQDIARSIERVRELVRQLDKPVRQVLVESRIVIAQNNFLRELGAKLGLNRLVPGRPQTVGASLIPTEGVLPVNATQGATYGDALVDLGAAAAAALGIG